MVDNIKGSDALYKTRLTLPKLEDLCLMVITGNKFLAERVNVLHGFPNFIIDKLLPYLSAYGIHLLEENHLYKSNSLSDIWLRRHQIPPCSRLDVRNHMNHMLDGSEMTTSKAIFYNGLLKDVTESLNSNVPIEQCHLGAWNYFTSYQPNMKTSHTICLRDFLLLISSQVTLLHLTALSAHRIQSHIELFVPVFKFIQKIHITFLSGSFKSYSHFTDLCSTIRILRMYNLTKVKIMCQWDMEKTDFTTVLNSFCMELNTNVDCEKDESVISLDDLYDVALERQIVNTSITAFEFYTSQETELHTEEQCKFLISWKNLQRLVLPCLSEAHVDYLSMLCLHRYQLQELHVSYFIYSMHNEMFENCLIKLLSPKCVVHNNCTLIKTFIYEEYLSDRVVCRILQGNHCSEFCTLDGLLSLKIGFKNDPSVIPYFSKNTTLRDICLTGVERDHPALIMALAEHQLLQTIQIHSNRRSPLFPISAIIKLLKSRTLRQLELEYCFHSAQFGDGICKALYDSNLTVFLYQRNGLESRGLIELANVVRDNGLRRLHSLDIRENCFNGDAVLIFSDAFEQSRRYLCKLAINYHLMASQKDEITKKLKSCTKTLLTSCVFIKQTADYISEM